MKLHNPRTVLAILFASIALIFTTGCGSSNDDFAFANNGNNGNANAGDLIFRFQKAVAQTIVDPLTGTLQFDFHSTNPPTDGSLVFSESRLFSELIVFNGVPTNVVFVEVSLFSEGGVPVSRFSAPVSVNPLTGTEIDLGTPQSLTLDSISVTPDPVNLVITNLFGTDFTTFSLNGLFEGQTIPLPINPATTTFNVNHPFIQVDENGIAFIDDPLIVFAEMEEELPILNTTATATYNFNGASVQDDFRIDVYLFASEFSFIPFFFEGFGVAVAPGETIDEWLFQLVRPNGLSEQIADADLQFELVGAPLPNVTLTNGVLNVDAGAVDGQSFEVKVTFVDDGNGGSGLTFSTEIFFEVDDV